MNKTTILISAVAIAAAAGAAIFFVGDSEQKAASPTERAIKDRQANFKTMGAIMKSIEEQTKSDDPDQKKIADGANRLASLGADIPNWFPVGSGPDSGFATHAKPDIWSDNGAFLQRQDEYMTEARKLASVAASGTMAEVTSQFYTTGVACANCHKPFRAKMD
jgi:cytochrome c556